MMDIIINLVNLMSEKINLLNTKIDNMNDKNLINNVLSKLDFTSNNYKIIKKDNKIYIKCHSYFINVFKDDDDNDEEFKKKIIEYNQPMIFSHTGNSCMPPSQYYNEIINNIEPYKNRRNLFICIKYADITIDLETKSYNIIKSNFNIRKPTNDTSNLFEMIINNIDNPSYYFILDYDLSSINNSYSDFKNNIYDLNKINLNFTDDNNNIKINVIMPSVSSITKDIDTKPTVSNQIKRKNLNGGFI